MKLWTDGTETWAADTVEQARALQRETCGTDPAPVEEWKERTSPDPLTLHMEEEGKVTKTLAEWIATLPTGGFLCSTEL